jgi:hypothetical protein
MERYKIISNYVVTLDASSMAFVNSHSWTATADSSGRVSIQVTSGPLKGQHLSRLLTNCPSHLIVDHKDGNSLNNTLRNLRLATLTQNQANRKVQTTNKSGVKGVSWCSRSSKWKAYISRQHLGYFDSLEEAKRAYERAAELLHGEFALHRSRCTECDDSGQQP